MTTPAEPHSTPPAQLHRSNHDRQQKHHQPDVAEQRLTEGNRWGHAMEQIITWWNTALHVKERMMTSRGTDHQMLEPVLSCCGTDDDMLKQRHVCYGTDDGMLVQMPMRIVTWMMNDKSNLGPDTLSIGGQLFCFVLSLVYSPQSGRRMHHVWGDRQSNEGSRAKDRIVSCRNKSGLVTEQLITF